MKTISKAMLILAVLSIASVAILARTTPVFADGTGTPGQPNQSCQTAFPSGPLQPPGFNSPGFTGPADAHYAGNGQNTQTPANAHAVSQYDVACFQAAQH